MLTGGGGSCKVVESTLSATLGVEKFLPCHCDEVDTLSCQREGKCVFTLSEVKGKTPLLKIRRGVGVRSEKAAFTLAEGATYVGTWKGNCKAAFTLAEVLITLGIIGVVAAITMPTVIANINERVNSERQANIAQKVTQAMEQMRAHGLLNTQYTSTDAFVDELQKYLKIAKRCDSEHIADCWPTATVTTGDGEEFEVSEAKTRKNLIKNAEDKTKNVGLVLADGASIIMTYDINARTLDVGDEVRASRTQLPVGGGKLKDFPYTTSVTGAIDFVMDVNGGKGPNSETINNKMFDIRSFKVAKFSKACAGIKIDGIGCVVKIDSYESSGTYACPWSGGTCNDYWSGAKVACQNIGMQLPDISTLTSISKKKNEYAELPQSGYFWTSTEVDNLYAGIVDFSKMMGGGSTGKQKQEGVLCIDN